MNKKPVVLISALACATFLWSRSLISSSPRSRLLRWASSLRARVWAGAAISVGSPARSQAPSDPRDRGGCWRPHLSALILSDERLEQPESSERAGSHRRRPLAQRRGGELVAKNVADLHGDVERDRNNIYKLSALMEKEK